MSYRCTLCSDILRDSEIKWEIKLNSKKSPLEGYSIYPLCDKCASTIKFKVQQRLK